MKRQSLAIIIPTFNEAQNITKIISQINANTHDEVKIIIVDDNSPDKTGEIADHLAKSTPNLIVVHRKEKGGRGSAVMEGFRYARKFRPSFYIEMDADFSHKPKDLPRLVREIETTQKDVIIGSRYLPASRIFNWSIRRKMFSQLSNFYAKVILGIPISDYTNGFRIYSKEAIDFLLSKKLESTGYILLSETAYKLKKAGFGIREIPIVFVNRKRGESNLSFEEIKKAFLGVLKIRFS